MVDAERLDGVTPLLLAAQEGHVGRHHHCLHRGGGSDPDQVFGYQATRFRHKRGIWTNKKSWLKVFI